jgi:hypothetical protein
MYKSIGSLYFWKEVAKVQKPIKVKIDTTTSCTVTNYSNIRKGDTLKMTIVMYQDSESLDLTGQSMHIILRKADGYSVEKRISSVTGNLFDINFDIQATLAVGYVEGEVQVSDLNGNCISNHFTFEVKPTLGEDIVIKSADQIETLQQIIGLINTYNANADNLAIQNQLALQNEANLSALNSNAETLTNRVEEDIVDATEVAERVEEDISKGNQLDSNLKQDFSIGFPLHDKLLVDIANGNDIIQKLPSLNWNVILSYIDLMNTMLGGSRLTDGNGNYLTDGNGNYLTIG